MSEPSDRGKGWVEQPKNIDRIVYALYAVCAVVALLDFIVHRHEYLDFAGWFGFYAWYGFIACVGLVIAAKGLRKLIMRSEDYYDETPPGQDKTEDDR
ncbi:MAG: hypothetical protein U5L08_11790 [Xanthomonadales bacterium]|nr:hypothetical protein [Xanthomonadales bacterium]